MTQTPKRLKRNVFYRAFIPLVDHIQLHFDVTRTHTQHTYYNRFICKYSITSGFMCAGATLFLALWQKKFSATVKQTIVSRYYIIWPFPSPLPSRFSALLRFIGVGCQLSAGNSSFYVAYFPFFDTIFRSIKCKKPPVLCTLK